MIENTNLIDVNQNFLINLDCFEGPIDLLLHLVKKNELEITTLSLSEVCNQYLQCIDLMRELDLELAGEYLVIAATLVSIKSSILLNKPVELVEDEDGLLVDPHSELLARLKEAEIYKDGANQLAELDYLGLDIFSGKSQLNKFKAIDVGFVDHDSYLLGKAFYGALKRLKDQKVYQVILESVSIVDRMNFVMNKLNSIKTKVVFQELIEDANSKASVIGTFLALLELCKRQIISVEQGLDQNNEDGQIFICLKGAEQDNLNFDSEFDTSVNE